MNQALDDWLLLKVISIKKYIKREMDSGLKVDKTIPLGGLLGAMKEATDAAKNVLFFDETGNVSTFFSYKATLFELNKEILSKAMGKKTHEEVKERFRKMIINTMKSGDNLAIFVDMSIPDFKAEFYDPEYVHPDIFDQELMDKKDNYKSMLRPDEDVDGFGNKGGFYKRDGWVISVVTRGSVEEEGANAKKFLPLDKFYVVRVTN